MAWCYCPACDAGNPKPNVYEVMAGERDCCACRHTFPTHPFSKDDLITEMAEDIEYLKAAVLALSERLDEHAQALNQGPNP